jgi:hypothetical protein
MIQSQAPELSPPCPPLTDETLKVKYTRNVGCTA